jgi:acyl-CoA reductase-like NAD-dependent aldehyde dehydrogenase
MCDGLKRLIVHESRYDELVEKLGAKLLSKNIGDPSDESTDIGPLVSASQLSNIESQFQDALDL